MSATLDQLFLNAAQRFGPSLAVTRGEQSRTYSEVLDRARRLVHVLREHGVQPGDKVAAMLGVRIESLEVYVALALGGYTAVHVNDRLTAPEVDHVLTNSGSRALVTTDGVDPVASAAEVVPGLAAWVSISEQAPDGAVHYESASAAADATPVAVTVDPEDVALIAYTSGTTGFPKGVLVSHRAITACITLVPYAYRLPLRGHCAFPGGWSFASGLWGVIFPHFYTGGTVSFTAGMTPEEWGAHMVENRTTFTLGLTPLIPGLLQALTAHPKALDTIQGVLHSGGPLPPELAEQLVAVIGDRLVETWGMTEVIGPITITNRTDWTDNCDADDIFASVGRPLPTASVRVVDADGNDLAPGEVGELLIEADTCFSGYHGNPEKTAEALRDGWYHTGDLGYADAAGYLYLTGRSQELIISGGANVYPAEVERVLLQHDEVLDVAVFGEPDERWGEAVSAAVVTRPDSPLTGEELKAFARERLAGYKKPGHIYFLTELPRNASLKVMKHVLKETLAGTDEPVTAGTTEGRTA